jgi:hypothetical protein
MLIKGCLLCLSLMIAVQVQALDLLKPFSRLFGGDKGIVIWKGPGQYVKIVDQDWDYDHRRPPKNAHPAHIKPEELAIVLASIRAPDPEGSELVPVFTMEAIRTLSEQLSIALDRSQPDQDVVFGVADNYKNLSSSGLRSTGCRVFLQGGALNMIFGDILEPEASFSDNTSQYSKPHRAGRRIESNGRDIRVAGGPGIFFWHGRGIERRDWILIDIPRVIAAYRGPTPQLMARTTGVTMQQGLPVANQDVAAENRRLREELARARKRMSQEQQNNASTNDGEAPGQMASAADVGMQQDQPVDSQDIAAQNRRLREELARARQRMSQQQNNVSTNVGTASGQVASAAGATMRQSQPVASQGVAAENRKLREELARARKRMSTAQQNKTSTASNGEAPLAAAPRAFSSSYSGTATAREPGSAASGGIVQRLTTLKLLYEKKLITKAEYDAKRKEIIEKF